MPIPSIKPLFFHHDGRRRIYGDGFVDEVLSLLDLRGRRPVLIWDEDMGLLFYTGEIANPYSTKYWVEIDGGEALMRPKEAKRMGITDESKS